MSSMYGADITQLRALATQFDRTADQLEHSRMVVGTAIRISAWVGPFASSFRLAWDSQHSQRIVGAARLLRENARLVRANADAQERTSAVDGLSLGIGGTVSGGGKSGGWQSWFGDRFNDILDAGGAAVGWVDDRAADLWNAGATAVGWVGDRAVDVWNAGTAAADWAGDRAADAWNWAGDRVAAIGDDWANVGGAASQYWDATGGSILDGRWPRTTEVVASEILLGGAILGAVATTASGGTVETNLFDDGKPYVGGPKPASGVVTTPDSLESLTASVSDAYGAGDGVVRITTIQTENGPRVIVSVPGTEEWSPIGGNNAMDLTGNLVTAGGGRSTMTEAVELALAKANIPPGAQVALVGHSQGGMTVAALIADPDFVSRYNVTNAITFGSPVDSVQFDSRVKVLELQHASDIVPKLDMGDALYAPNPFVPGLPIIPGIPSGYDQAGPQNTSVTLPDAGGPFDVGANHDDRNYSSSIANSSDPDLLAYESQLRASGFLSGTSANTTAVDIPVGRRN
ncbi:MAG: hypothetical protein ACOH1Y_00180 [Propionicimonas sp.]